MAHVDAELRAENERLRAELSAEGQRADAAEAREAAVAAVFGSLRSISGDMQAILNGIAEQAVRLTASDQAHLFILRDGSERTVPVAGWDRLGRAPAVSLQNPGDGSAYGAYAPSESVSSTAMAELRTIAVAGGPDMVADRFPATAAGWRRILQRDGTVVGSAVHVPLVSGAKVLGALVVRRPSLGPYSAQQIAFLETFASQAVIAMETARLFDELEQRNTELAAALEQQTAVAGVLQAISRSAFDLQAVLDTLVENAGRLLGSPRASLAVLQGGQLRWVADPERGYRWQAPSDDRGHSRTYVAESLRRKQTLQVHGGVEGVAAHYPESAAIWQEEAARGTPVGSAVVAPLHHGDDVVGLLMVRRPAAEPYSGQQIALLETFADQAAIAIENSRLLEELRDANAKLQEANAAKSQFLSTMSHELRTPLNAVIGYSELLREEAEEEGLAGMVPDLVRINGAGKHLLSLINNVLDISKIEAGKMELELQDFVVGEVLAEVEAVVPPLMSRNGNQFVMKIDTRVGPMHSDKVKLRQCLLNLLSNAAKFTEQGAVALTVARTTDEAGDRLIFSVSDTGIGMTAEQVGRLFRNFTQAEAGIAGRYGGTGLGLSLSREFARLMGGDITVESEAGKGSTFSLTLPAAVAVSA